LKDEELNILMFEFLLYII